MMPMQVIESANCHQAGINETETCYECHDGIDNDGDGESSHTISMCLLVTATDPVRSIRHIRLRRRRLCRTPNLSVVRPGRQGRSRWQGWSYVAQSLLPTALQCTQRRVCSFRRRS